MGNEDNTPDEFHWIMEVLQSIDVGLVVMNCKFEVELWNSFMQNHSSMMPVDVLGKSIFELFPELSKNWFIQKTKSVFLLRNTAFTTWEQRNYLFKFKNYRPVTGTAPYMYQNCSVIPLSDTLGKVDRICLTIYDVTEAAINKKGMLLAQAELEKQEKPNS